MNTNASPRELDEATNEVRRIVDEIIENHPDWETDAIRLATANLEAAVSDLIGNR